MESAQAWVVKTRSDPAHHQVVTDEIVSDYRDDSVFARMMANRRK